MAASQTTDAGKGAKGGSSTRRRLMVGGFVLLLAGIVTGTGLWQMQNGATKETGKTVDVNRADEGQALLPIGRITVNVGAAGALSEKRSRYLVIEPTLLYATAYDTAVESPGMKSHQSALRDSFIEYLSQLHENDVYGSAGLAELRIELLRRARLVTASDAPIGILLQDFVLQ